MELTKEMRDYGHEQVVFVHDEKSKLQAIIAIHNTVLGPALGGTRMWNYATEDDALYDVLRLSRGMTLKNAAAGLHFGGGKAVIIGDPAIKSKEMLEAYGAFLNRLNGNYITAEDVNISVADAEVIHTRTKYVSGLLGSSGDPSPLTARGVWQGIKATAKAVLSRESLEGLTIAVQGLGKVGWSLCERLYADGVRLIVSDINQGAVKRAAEEFGAAVSTPERIIFETCDIFAPCALGAVLHTQNISELRCKAVAGAANNVLTDESTGDLLKKRSIAYAPDYIINAGGVINVAAEASESYDPARVLELVDNIYNTVFGILEESQKTGDPEYKLAEKLARRRIEEKRNLIQ